MKGIYQRVEKVAAWFVPAKIHIEGQRYAIKDADGMFVRVAADGELQFLGAAEFAKLYKPVDRTARRVAGELAHNGSDPWQLNACKANDEASTEANDEVELDLGKTITAEDTMVGDGSSEALPIPAEVGQQPGTARSQGGPGFLAGIINDMLTARARRLQDPKTIKDEDRCGDRTCPVCSPPDATSAPVDTGEKPDGPPAVDAEDAGYEVIEIRGNNAEDLLQKVREALMSKIRPAIARAQAADKAQR
jgi:hypothetical protein